jgi:hypothetical protein
MALIREVDGGKWQIQQPSPFEAPLAKGLKLVRKLEADDQKEPVTLTYELKDSWFSKSGQVRLIAYSRSCPRTCSSWWAERFQ